MLSNLLYAITLLVVSLPAYLLETIEVASSSAVIELQQKKGIYVSDRNTLEKLSFCADLCIQVHENIIDLPVNELVETKVKVRLLSEMTKQSLITLAMRLIDSDSLGNIE